MQREVAGGGFCHIMQTYAITYHLDIICHNCGINIETLSY